MMMGCGSLECFYLDAKHFAHKTNPMEQAKARKSCSGERKMKMFLKVWFGE